MLCECHWRDGRRGRQPALGKEHLRDRDVAQVNEDFFKETMFEDEGEEEGEEAK